MNQRFILLIAACLVAGTAAAQDVLTLPLVYQIPAMEKVQIKAGNTYKTVRDTAFHFDLYYPENYQTKGTLPLVVFINLGSMEIPTWRVYKDWAKLVATRDMAAVVYQCRGNTSLKDTEDLIEYLRKQAGSLQLDPERIGIWACSANVRNGFTLAMQPNREYLRCLVMYYGIQPENVTVFRQDLPIQMVRAGLDASRVNDGIDRFLAQAMQQDLRLEFVNYLEGMHAFDIFNNQDESREIIIRTLDFMQKHLRKTPAPGRYILTNKNFLWMMQNGQQERAFAEFRKAREYYKTDPNFHPFYNAVVREDMVINIGYALLGDKKYDASIQVFELITAEFPNSANAWDSLSEAYEAKGEKEKAKTAAQKALDLLDQDTTLDANFKATVKAGSEARLKRL